MTENLAYRCRCGSILYNNRFVNLEELPEEVVILPEPNSVECVKNLYGSGTTLLEKRVIEFTHDGETQTIHIPKKFEFCPAKNGA